MKKRSNTIFKWASVFLAASSLIFWACQLTQDGGTEDTVSFTKIYDSLARFDSVVIVFKDRDGRLLDTVYQGKVDTRAEIEKLPVKGWDGGEALITIVGFDAGVAVYQAEKRFNGASDRTDTTVVVLDRVHVERVRFLKDSTELFVGGAAESLLVEVLPLHSDPAVDFLSADPTKVEIKGNKISGRAEGVASILVSSRENPALADTLKVKVSIAQHVDGVQISPRTLKLFTGGDSALLVSTVTPSSATQKTGWSSGNAAVAKVDQNGKVSPVSPGQARIYAVSLADSTKKDSADVTVKRDAPQISVGRDTTVSVGQTVAILPVAAPQEFGKVVEFKWDLDGDLNWDDSDAVVKSVSHEYDQEKEYSARFYVRDTEGNETIAVKKVKAVKGLIVLIVSPADDSYTNQAAITVKWKVDEKDQDTLPKVILKDGPNTITKTATDGAGTPFSASITVYLDTLPPNKPIVHGPATSATVTPTWSWTTGGPGGNGVYRSALDQENFASSPEAKDTVFTPAAALAEGAHTLFVQERDAAGNWSQSGRFSVTIDLSGPGKPNVKVNTPAMTNVQKPAWTWTGTGDGTGVFQYKVDNADFTTGAIQTTETGYTPTANLAAGLHTVYVREKDAAGNWSAAGSASTTIDITAPIAPKVTGASPTSANPKWTWTGGGGGSGDFRYKEGGDGNPATGGTETRETSYTLASAASGTTYTLYVQERDEAGNWSPAAGLAIKYDLTKPTVSISSPQPSGTYYTTAATLALAGGTGGPNAIAKVSYSMDGGAAVNAVLGSPSGGSTPWTVAAIGLIEGKASVITVTATDALGGLGEATLVVLRDNTLPGAPGITSSPQTSINTASGTWVWSPGADSPTGSGLNGKYQYRIGGGAWVATTATTVANLALAEGVNAFEVQEQDKAGNWSLSAANTVTVDTKGPVLAFSAPATAGNTFTSTTSPDVAVKVSAVDAGVGVKRVDCSMSGATTGSFGPTLANGTWNATQAFASGTTTLTCTAYDNFDKAGASAFIKIAINIPKPVISGLSIANGMVTNKPSLTVGYVVKVGANTYNETSDPIALSEGANAITLHSKAKNLAGEAGDLAVTYYRRANAVFVDANASGANNGTSWADAYTEFHTALASAQVKNNKNAQVWMSKGDYHAGEGNVSLGMSVNLPESGFIIGGFDAAQLPSDTALSKRNVPNNPTVIYEYTMLLDVLNKKLEINGLQFAGTLFHANTGNGGFATGATLVMSNCIMLGMISEGDYWSVYGGHDVDFEMINCNVYNTTIPLNGTPYLADKWRLNFSAGGRFHAKNTVFSRSKSGFDYLAFLFSDLAEDSLPQEFIFDNCGMRYYESDGNFQINIPNKNSTMTINGGDINGGSATIHTAGSLTINP